MSHAYHITVAVSDIEHSKAFYLGIFTQLGWTSSFEDAEAQAWSDGTFDFWIVPAEKKEPLHHADGTGFNHFAFKVDSREEVDHFYDWLTTTSAKIDIPPKAYPHYSEKYYAVFFFDLDGTRLEVVYA